jgi:galactose mutarotase-like enzyme
MGCDPIENRNSKIKNWTLDEEQGTQGERLRLATAELGGALAGCEIVHRRLQGGLSDGVDVVHVQCGDMAFEVLPTRGMGIWKARVGGEPVGWQSPVRGPVHPKFVPLAEPGGLGWLDGFDEWLVRCGLESNGAPEFDEQGRLKYPLHGRIANRPAHRVEVTADPDAGEISVTGVVEETRFLFKNLRLTSTVTVRMGETALEVRDQVQNLSAVPAEMQLLYHINFGPPLLDAGARFIAPVRRVVPRDAHAAEGIGTWNRYAEGEAGFSEEVYFLELVGDADGNTLVLLRNAAQDRGVSMRINRQQLPCFTLWKNTASAADGYVTGLEPGTNFPNPRTFEGQRGRVVPLAPGATAAFDLRLEFHRQAEAIHKVEETIADMRGPQKPEICHQPQPDWCVI